MLTYCPYPHVFTQAQLFIDRRDSNVDDEETDQELDALVSRLECIVAIVEESFHLLASQHSTQIIFSVELQLLSIVRQKGGRLIRQILYGCDDCTIPPIGNHSVSVRSGRAGRPLLALNIELIEFLRSSGYTWQEVCSVIGVSRSTVWRRLKDSGIEMDKYTDISDSQLDDVVRRVQQQHPNVGQVMLQGFLKQQGVCVQRHRIRESVFRTDPLRRSLRWHQAVNRRTYSVKGANSLWHIDGHHSLIRWRFVVHGGIDGYSRLVIYLTCNTNNTSLTVFNDFLKATQEYGIPKRVRSDKGGENVKVCYFMVAHHGPNEVSHIAGSSTHNQRIERLWRDVFRCVLSTYHEMFYEMEALGVLDPVSELDLFVLHCMYLPRIRKSLSDFCKAWNLHPLRTEHNWSPKKIWVNSILRDSVDTSFDPEEMNMYGFDPSGPLPEDESTTVTVPDLVAPLDGEELEEFLTSVDINTIFDGHDMAISCYIATKNRLQRLLV